MRTSVRRPIVVACLVGLVLVVVWRSALLAQGQPARPAGPSERFAPGLAGGFGAAEAKPTPKPVATIYLTTPMTAPAARTWLKLQDSITLPFKDETPLEDVLRFIKDATKGKDDKGIPIYVDPIGLQEAEKTITSPVILALEDVPLSTGLTLLLKQLGLTYSVQKDGILIITVASNENAFGDPTARVLEEINALRLEVEDLRRQLGLRSPR
jgi:hypothetical protein